MSTTDFDAADAAAMAARLAPDGEAQQAQGQGQVRPAQRPTTADLHRRKAVDDLAAGAADICLGQLLTAYVGAQAATLRTTAFTVPEVQEIRQLVAMADRLGQRAHAELSVQAERG